MLANCTGSNGKPHGSQCHAYRINQMASLMLTNTCTMPGVRQMANPLVLASNMLSNTTHDIRRMASAMLVIGYTMQEIHRLAKSQAWKSSNGEHVLANITHVNSHPSHYHGICRNNMHEIRQITNPRFQQISCWAIK